MICEAATCLLSVRCSYREPCWSWENSMTWFVRSLSWRFGIRLLRKSSSSWLRFEASFIPPPSLHTHYMNVLQGSYSFVTMNFPDFSIINKCNIAWQKFSVKQSSFPPFTDFDPSPYSKELLDRMSECFTINFNCKNTVTVQRYPCSSHRQSCIPYFPWSQVKFPDISRSVKTTGITQCTLCSLSSCPKFTLSH